MAMLPVKAYDKKVPLPSKGARAHGLDGLLSLVTIQDEPALLAGGVTAPTRAQLQAQSRNIPLRPYFDMEGFMTMSHEKPAWVAQCCSA